MTRPWEPDERFLHHEIWAKEIALVYLEARDELSDVGLPVDHSELGDSVRRLQIILSSDAGGSTALEEARTLWDQYTVLSNRDEALPRLVEGDLKAVFFHLITILDIVRDILDWPLDNGNGSDNDQDDDELDDDDGRDDQDENSDDNDQYHGGGSDDDIATLIYGRRADEWSHDSRRARALIRDHFGETFEEQEQHAGNSTLNALRNIFESSADLAVDGLGTGSRHQYIHSLHELQRLQVDWRRPIPDTRRLTDPEEQNEMERILNDAVNVFRPIFSPYSDLVRTGRISGAWRMDLRWARELHQNLAGRRALSADEDQVIHDYLDAFLSTTCILLSDMDRDDILDRPPTDNRQRLRRLQHLQEVWREGGHEDEYPRLYGDDQRQWDDILVRLITALRQIYERDDAADDATIARRMQDDEMRW